MSASTGFAFHACWTFTDLISFNDVIYNNDNPAVATDGNDVYNC